MTKPKLTEEIMQKVVRFEKRRTGFWLGRLVLILVILLAILIGFFRIAARRLMETQTLELLTLFQKDKEEIAEFWQDTVAVIWAEAPQRAIIIILLTLVALLILFILFKKKLPVIRKRISDIAKFQKRVKNN